MELSIDQLLFKKMKMKKIKLKTILISYQQVQSLERIL